MNREQWDTAVQDAYAAVRPHMRRHPSEGFYIDAMTCPSPLENRFRGLVALGQRKGWVQ